jgi:23S rRNA pseudouridine955/2504/2580 synthase
MRHYPRISIGEFRKLCRTGQIRVNAGRVRGNEILYTDDVIRIPPLAAQRAGGLVKKSEDGGAFSMADLEQLRKRIIHDDADIVVFDKPAGLATQGGTGIKKSLDKMVAAMFPHDSILLVHRLDRETSGVIVVAKNQRAAKTLADEFRDKTAGKEYLAMLVGSVKQKRGTIDNFMTKGNVFNKEEAEVFRAESGLRPVHAITRYKVIDELPGVLTLVSFYPETGRTHQLRVHAAVSLGAPILGDALYGQQERETGITTMIESDKLFLLARRLTFRHPATGKEITVTAQIPKFMESAIKLLGFDEKD